ncbi:MAG: outer membrane beta-barrel protein [Deltaproteobacteria bacterium]|nr:outer membrane beta-barrel protein [Deltaproteobacteria bacterium]
MNWLRMGVMLRCWIAIVSTALPLGAASAESDSASLYDFTGLYVQTGITADFFDAHKGRVDFDPGVGITVAAGYRSNAYLAGQVDFTYIFVADTNDFTKLDRIELEETDDSKSLGYYEFIFSLKGYPLGSFEVSMVPDWIQPYVRFGLGFADIELGSLDEVGFLLEFDGGVDFMITDRLGVYLDGGYTVITTTVSEDDATILDGRGHLGLGALVRF